MSYPPTPPQGCLECWYYSSSPIHSPSGWCGLKDAISDDFSACYSFLDRKEGSALYQVLLATKILREPEKYNEHMPTLAEMILDRGGRRN